MAGNRSGARILDRASIGQGGRGSCFSVTDQPPKSIEALAQFFRVNERTIKRWRAKAAPLHSVEEMSKWMLTQKRIPAGAVARMGELTGKAPDGTTPRNAAWLKFKAEHPEPKSLVQQTELFAAFFKLQLDDALDRGHKGDQKFFSEQFFDASNSIRQQKLAADKLGIEEGQLFTKEQLQRVFRAWTFWAMRGADDILAECCPRSLDLKTVPQARAIWEPAILSQRFVKPFAKASRVESESSLSPWMVETMKDAVDDFIENGAKEFEEST